MPYYRDSHGFPEKADLSLYNLYLPITLHFANISSCFQSPTG